MSDNLDLKVLNEKLVTTELDERIRQMLCQCFPRETGTFSKTRAWHGSGPNWSVYLEDEQGQIAAHAGMVDRMITVDQRPLHVGGIQNVCVLPSFRGRGLCQQVMKQIAEVAKGENYDAGLLFCVPELVQLYSREYWRRLPQAEVLRIDDSGNERSLPQDNIPMYFPIKIEAWPPGLIHLRGNDW